MGFFWYNNFMFLDKLSQNITSFRQNIILGIFLFLIVFSSFFSGEWNNWLMAVILVVVFPLVFYTLLLLRDGQQSRDVIFNFKSPFFYLLVFLGVGLVTTFFSQMQYNSGHYLVLLTSLAVIFWVGSVVFRNFSKIKIIALAIFFTGLAASLISLFLFVKDHAERTAGLLQNANALGSYLLFAAPLGLILTLDEENKKLKGVMMLGTVIILLGFVLTFSLTAWVSFVIPLAIIIGYYWKSLFTKKNILIFLGVLIILLVATVGVRYLNSRDFKQAVQLHKTISSFHLNYSFEQRWNFINSALDIFMKNPIAGTGLATFQQVYPRHAFSVLEQPRYAHNYYLQTAAETGIAGFLALMGFIISLLVVVYRATKKFWTDDSRRPYLLGLALGLLGSCFHSLFDFGWQFPAVFLLFWISGGIFMGQKSVAETEKISEEKPTRSIIKIISKLTLVIVSLFILVRGLTLFLSQSYEDRAELKKIEGDLAATSEFYSLAVKLDPAPKKQRAYAQALFQQGAADKDRLPELSAQAEKIFQNISKYNPGDYFSFYEAGKMYFMLKEYSQAEAAYQRAIELDPIFHPDFYYDLAFLYYSQDKYELVIDTLQPVIDRYKDVSVSSNPYLPNQLAWQNFLVGQAYQQRGNIEQARNHWQESLRLMPGFQLAWDELNKLGQ